MRSPGLCTRRNNLPWRLHPFSFEKWGNLGPPRSARCGDVLTGFNSPRSQRSNSAMQPAHGATGISKKGNPSHAANIASDSSHLLSTSRPSLDRLILNVVDELHPVLHRSSRRAKFITRDIRGLLSHWRNSGCFDACPGVLLYLSV
jgi:hypothetical protein